MESEIKNLEQQKKNLKSKYKRDCQNIDNQIQYEKDLKRREKERKKQEKEIAKNSPPPPLKPDPKYDPSYNKFIQDTLDFKELYECLKQFLDP